MPNSKQNLWIVTIATTAVIFAFCVVMLGAYTRLTDAGLGCPDWPGCYGQLVLPKAQEALNAAQKTFPQIPIESRKAWTEMAHRYAAGTLGLLILFIAVVSLVSHASKTPLPWHLPLALLLLLVFQAALGKWTVTMKLLPVVVMGHLLGGMLIFACLSRFRVQISRLQGQDLPEWRPWLRLGVFIVFFQIALGGWVSANYAGISCIGFPQCNGMWWPEIHFAQGFNVFSSIGANYQGGLLDNDIRVTIQFIHRLGALITAAYVLTCSIAILIKSRFHLLRGAAAILIVLVLTQFTLGILNVVYLLPLPVAVAHNGVGALLLATLFSTLHFTRGRQQRVG